MASIQRIPETDPPPEPATVTDPTAPLTVHVISGSKEYQSEDSLKPFLADLEKHYRVTVTTSRGSDGGETLQNLDALKTPTSCCSSPAG